MCSDISDLSAGKKNRKGASSMRTVWDTLCLSVVCKWVSKSFNQVPQMSIDGRWGSFDESSSELIIVRYKVPT